MDFARAGRLLTLVTFLVAGGAARAEDDPGFELVHGASPALKVRQSAALSLSIVPHAGHHLLASGPVLVRLRGDGLKPQRPLYHRDEAVDPHADVPRFELRVTAERAGPARLLAECTFYLCRGELCRPVEVATSWSVDVSP